MDRRGSSATQLKTEQAMRKRIMFLPSLTKTIMIEVSEWERQSSRGLMVNGERYLDKIARDEEEWKNFKDNLKLDRDKRKEDCEKHRRFDNTVPQAKSKR